MGDIAEFSAKIGGKLHFSAIFNIKLGNVHRITVAVQRQRVRCERKTFGVAAAAAAAGGVGCSRELAELFLAAIQRRELAELGPGRRNLWFAWTLRVHTHTPAGARTMRGL